MTELTTFSFDSTLEANLPFIVNVVTVPADDDSEDNEYEMSVALYSDPAFGEWQTEVNSSRMTDQDKENDYDYSSYTLWIKCDITKIAGVDFTSGRTDSGCCLRDDSHSQGGYCMTLNSD